MTKSWTDTGCIGERCLAGARDSPSIHCRIARTIIWVERYTGCWRR
jgi:hypothetical protein